MSAAEAMRIALVRLPAPADFDAYLAAVLASLDEQGYVIVERAASKEGHVPTPDELDDLLEKVCACGYASEAVRVVEDWTRKWFGVESAFTTRHSGKP